MATAIEYGILGVLASVAIVAGVITFGGSENNTQKQVKTTAELIEENKTLTENVRVMKHDARRWDAEAQSWCSFDFPHKMSCTPEFFLPPETVKRWRTAIKLDPDAPRMNPMTGEWVAMPVLAE